MGLTQASKSLRCEKAFSFSEYSVLRIQNIALEIKRNLNFESKYDSFVPNKTQIKFVKFVLGVHKSATNIAVLSLV
jgi:hypothetical protein